MDAIESAMTALGRGCWRKKPFMCLREFSPAFYSKKEFGGSFEFVLLRVPTLDVPDGLSPALAQLLQSHSASCGVSRIKELKPSCPWLVFSSG